MKICRFRKADEIYLGIVEGDEIWVCNNNLDKTHELCYFDEIELLPVASPSKVVCVGRNYAEHAKELGNEVPSEPLLFLKAPSAIIGHNDAIVIPSQSNKVEHEGELAVIIRRECKNLADDDDPFKFVFGYTCLNDVTARDIQRKDVQFTRGKSFDTFCPVGPFIETELDVTNIRVMTRVNGAIKQDGRTSQMVFPVDFLIRYISNMMTLLPGDVIATGTPSGVSKLESGDVCEVEIEGIGVLQNPVK
jgi:2-keto-4-pentenoate hydratase/2-oxohepta-3-ene-1,7-dioic acid hydratase (catechol pathway)